MVHLAESVLADLLQFVTILRLIGVLKFSKYVLCINERAKNFTFNFILTNNIEKLVYKLFSVFILTY